MTLSEQMKVALDEPRMQRLGTRVLFGFQLRGVFEEGFDRLSWPARLVDYAALVSVVASAALLIAAPAQHRVVEQGNASARLLTLTGRLGNAALVLLALTIGCDGFLVSDVYYGDAAAISTAVMTLMIAMGAWCGVGLWLRKKYAKVGRRVMIEKTQLRDKIDQMLTEARVILPGVQGIFGFQLLIPMTDAFEHLPKNVQHWPFAAVFAMALSIILLIAPAAIHRVAFRMADDPHFLSLGSRLVSWALAPFMAGIAADFYVATGKMVGYRPASAVGAVIVFAALFGAWYLWPWAIRRGRAGATSRSERGAGPRNTA